MLFPILRFKKHKSGSVSACCAHNERKKEEYKSNPDINPYETPSNYHILQPKQTYRREVKRIIAAAGCKSRSNSTVMVEALITATPEFINALPTLEQWDYFERAFHFVESQIGKGRIISAVVHMDERTPHMHLVFCPITPDRRLSAKKILGNPAKLSQWQTDYHAHMSERWPELERGISAQITKRKHIPTWLFKSAERLDKQFTEVEAALAGINPLNAKKQRENALKLLSDWLPRAERFTAQVKTVDEHIKSLERAEREAERRERSIEQRVDSAVARMQSRIDDKESELAKAQKESCKQKSSLFLKKVKKI